MTTVKSKIDLDSEFDYKDDPQFTSNTLESFAICAGIAVVVFSFGSWAILTLFDIITQ